MSPSFAATARHDDDAPITARMDPERRRQAVRDLLADHYRMMKAGRRRRTARLRAFAGFGAVLRRLRHRKGLTQTELARAAGMTRAMISAFEHEKTLPEIGTLDRLLTALGVSVAELGREMEAEDL